MSYDIYCYTCMGMVGGITGRMQAAGRVIARFGGVHRSRRRCAYCPKGNSKRNSYRF